jgi:hypothetical protein
MRYLITLFLFASSVFAGQSIVIDGTGSTMTFTDPNRANTLDYRVEFQLHNFSTPGSFVNGFITLNGVGMEVDYTTSGELWLDLKRDSVTGGAPCVISLAGRTNVLVRVQRDYSELIYHCEIWNVDGTGYAYTSKAITSVNSWVFSGGELKETNMSAQIGFVRADADIVAVNSRPPVTADTGDIVELKFDGNGNDSSGNGRNLNSVAGVTFAATPGQVAISLPATPNTPNWAPFVPLRAGYPSQITSNSYSMADASADVTCLWFQMPHASGEALTSTAIFDDRTSCTPTITGTVFGPYKFRLVVTDASGSKGTADLDVGAVAYDSNGVVIYPDDRLNDILGPSVVFGSNPWQWADRQHIIMAQFNWDNYALNGGTWDAEWLLPEVAGIPREGTVYTSASTPSKIYGVGTNFLDVFCGGSVGAVSAVPRHIVVNLPPTTPGDEPRRYYRYIASCQSDTEMTFQSGWIWERTHIASPGVTWGTIFFCAGCSTWGGTSVGSDVNYYDNALGHYSLYYRTGWIKARDSARWMADRHPFSPWWEVTFIPRHLSLTGAFLRAAIDPGGLATETWPLLRLKAAACESNASGSADIVDVRESAYCLAFIALDGLLDPDSTTRTASRDVLVTAYADRWGPQQQADGNFISKNAIEGDTSRVHQLSNGSATVTRFSGSAYPSDYCGTVATEAGTISIDNTDRVTVTGTGTNFTGHAGKVIFIRGTLNSQPWSMAATIASVSSSTAMVLNHPWRGDASSVTDYRIMSALPAGRSYWTMSMGSVTSGNVLTGDQDTDNWYWCRYVDGNTLTLDKPYTGDTSTNPYRRWTWQNLTGRGSQPFVLGITAWVLYLAAEALDGYNDAVAADYRTQAGEVVDWIWTHGRHELTKGLRYGVGWSNCQVTTYSSAFECWSTDAGNERSYNIEVINAFSRKYLHTANATDLTRLETLYTDTYAKDGFSTPIAGDGVVAGAVSEGEYNFSFNLQTKNYGQAWGVGGGQTAPAARVGGPAAPVLRTHLLALTLPAGATDALITKYLPNGATATQVCSSFPCTLTGVDVRAGGPAISWTWRDAGGNALGSSSLYPIQK